MQFVAENNLNNQHILERAIQKAMLASWDMYDYDKWEWEVVDSPGKTEKYHYFIRVWLDDLENFIDVSHIIFDTDFAKALWGEKPMHLTWNEHKELVPDKNGLEKWQYHLQQMVIADDPIAYLGASI